MTSEDAVAGDHRADALIRAKVRVPAAGTWVARPRVERQLADLIARHPVVVVAATAGAGKTTLVAAVARALDRPVGWLTLDRTDVAPGRLVTYLEAALAAAIPATDGVASGALAARVPHPEAAGLLAEAATGARALLVLDELERLGDADEAWAVLEALLRYAPADMRLVLCSRRAIPASVLPRRPDAVASLGDDALALTAEEAAALLRELGEPDLEADAVVRATGGWVTGVLFEVWRLGERAAAGGGEADPLHGYLAAHIVESLTPEDRDFLTATSLLDEVTVERAEALGCDDAAARLASLRSEHIPATWLDGGRALRCHTRFREYLQHCLELWGADRVRSLCVAFGRMLAAEGHDEEATDALLAAGATAEALEPAGRAIVAVINRLDFAVAERWLRALAAVEPDGMSPLVMARLMLALAKEDHRPGLELVERLAERGTLSEVVSSSSAAALMVGQCYVMAGRYDELLSVVAQAPRDADYEMLRQYGAVYGYDPRPPRPEPTGGPLDGVLLAIDYGHGLLADVLDRSPVGWVQAFAQPWLIAALADYGRTQEALRLYEEVRARGPADTSIEAVVGPRLLTDAGRREEALAAIARGRRRAREGWSLVYELLAGVAAARLALRLDRDPARARTELDEIERNPSAQRIGFVGEQLDLWYGRALLLENRDADALARLRRSVGRMRRSGRSLEMPTAAVFLAEAEWRAGNEEEADRAADLALEAACKQGSNHMLLRALGDCPAVLSRRLDAEPAADSPWHELGRALRAQGVGAELAAGGSLQLLEFGRCAILVDGEEVKPRIAKTYELLAYLLTQPDRRADRGALLDALFDGRADESARAYLRQAILWLRHVLPDGSVLADRRSVRLADELMATSESVQLEAALAVAARLRGEERLAATLPALAVLDRGAYLPAAASRWADERRLALSDLATDARFEAAELAFSACRLDQAEALARAVLDAEPFHEAAWRLTMRIAGARGDEQGVIRAYQRCEQTLAEVGAAPSETTRQLLASLRR